MQTIKKYLLMVDNAILSVWTLLGMCSLGISFIIGPLILFYSIQTGSFEWPFLLLDVIGLYLTMLTIRIFESS